MWASRRWLRDASLSYLGSVSSGGLRENGRRPQRSATPPPTHPAPRQRRLESVEKVLTARHSDRDPGDAVEGGAGMGRYRWAEMVVAGRGHVRDTRRQGHGEHRECER